MTERLRKLGLVGVVAGGALLFGVGFAGAQSPSEPSPSPKGMQSEGASSTYQGGGGGCGDHGAAEVTSIDL